MEYTGEIRKTEDGHLVACPCGKRRPDFLPNKWAVNIETKSLGASVRSKGYDFNIGEFHCHYVLENGIAKVCSDSTCPGLV